MEQKRSAIILVAGNSTRFGQGTNKNLIKVRNKYVLNYSIEAFDQNSFITDILVVVKQGEEEQVQKIMKETSFSKPIKIVIGGASRQESVYHAITATDADIVMIHDGARCMIKQEYITKCIQTMQEQVGVSIAVKSKDTIKITNEEGIVVSTTERKNTWIVQTPQCFKREILRKGHEMFQKDSSITDDCMILEKMGQPIKLIEGDYTNIKITTQEDIELAERFLK